MKFEDAWALAFKGQRLRSGAFIITKGEFLTSDLLLAFYSGLPMNEGWEIDKSDIKIKATYEALI